MPGDRAEVLERLVRLEEQVLGLREDLAELRAGVGGPPWERSLRGRMHVIEAEAAAAKVAAHALAEARTERRRADDALAEAKRWRWDWRLQLVAVLAGLAVAAAPYVVLFAGAQ